MKCPVPPSEWTVGTAESGRTDVPNVGRSQATCQTYCYGETLSKNLFCVANKRDIFSLKLSVMNESEGALHKETPGHMRIFIALISSTFPCKRQARVENGQMYMDCKFLTVSNKIHKFNFPYVC